MVNFFKKKSRGPSKSKVVRELPKSYVCRKVIVGRKKTKIVCRPKSFYVKILVWFLLLVFLGTAGYIFFFSPLLTITSISIVGLEKISREEVDEIVASEKEGKLGGTLRRDNLIFFNKDDAGKILRNRYRLIRNVEINKEFPDKLLIKVQERRSQLVYCAAGNCLVLDEEGAAYAPADFQKNELGEEYLPIVHDEGKKEMLGDNFSIDLDFIQFVLDVKEQLETEDIRIKRDFSTPILVSGDLRVETEDGWKIFFNQQLGAEGGIEMLKTVLKNSIAPEQIKDLEYVDVRLADKVYYKLKTNSETESSQDNVNPVAETKVLDIKKEEVKKKK